MLVVVHNRDVALLFQGILNHEAFRRLDVFEVDAAECRRDGLDDADELLRVFLVHLYVEGIESGKYLEQQRFPLHDGLTGEGTDVAEAEDGGAVAYDAHEVALVGVAVNVGGIILDFKAGECHAGGIGEREVELRGIWFGGDDFYLSRRRGFVVTERHFAGYFYHNR